MKDGRPGRLLPVRIRLPPLRSSAGAKPSKPRDETTTTARSRPRRLRRIRETSAVKVWPPTMNWSRSRPPAMRAINAVRGPGNSPTLVASNRTGTTMVGVTNPAAVSPAMSWVRLIGASENRAGSSVSSSGNSRTGRVIQASQTTSITQSVNSPAARADISPAALPYLPASQNPIAATPIVTTGRPNARWRSARTPLTSKRHFSQTRRPTIPILRLGHRLRRPPGTHLRPTPLRTVVEVPRAWPL